MREFEAEVLFRPESDELCFLPEGPYPCGKNRFSWVGIQHGANSQVGSLNIFDVASRTNTTYILNGRPGFCFSANVDHTFLVGLERRLWLYSTATQNCDELSEEIDTDVENTIINDGAAFDGGVIFGSKELTFSKPTAGLYLWRYADKELIRLRDDQICSNGKIVFTNDGGVTLLDIDSPTKKVVRYSLDVAAGQLSDPETILDLTTNDDFPDGMIATPDGNSVIIAFYNPNDIECGEARQYGIESGELEAIWKTPDAPQVTCPQLLEIDGQIKLVLTTAVEHMSAERVARHPNSGCLFVGDSEFTSLPDQPMFQVS